MARKLHFFREQMTKAGVSPSETPTVRCHLDFDDLEIRLGNLEAELIEVNANSEKLQQTYKELQEYMLVLRKMENPLMGWTSTGDPYANVGEAGLEFDSEEAAKAFAEKLGWFVSGWRVECILKRTNTCLSYVNAEELQILFEW